MKKIALLTAWVLASPCAFACDPVIVDGYTAFSPTAMTFEPRTGSDGQIALLPAPDVRVKGVSRALSGETPCGDTGLLEIEVIWPGSSSYRFDEVGFYFRVIAGEQPDRIFPLNPIKARWPKADRAQFVFMWMDGNADRMPLDLEVEVFAVNAGLEIGPARRFKVVSSSD